VLIDFWSGTTVSNGVWITILGLLLLVSNMFFVRIYGELEFAFATLKIMLILGLIVMVSPTTRHL
jgi:amino acid transporter